jgi:transglutaminase-like putative cysteine protease
MGHYWMHAQELKFSVSTIPEDLIKDVNAVVRADQMIFTIESNTRAVHKIYEVITILNGNGKRFARKTVGYDKLRKVTFSKGNVYDANGLLINKLKNSEIVDQSAFDGVSLYSDNRIKAIDLTQPKYPYTVEIEYEVEYKFLFYFPSFYALGGEKISVEKALCQFIYPKELAPRFKAFNLDAKPITVDLKNNVESKTWIFENLKPIKFEPLGPDYDALLPHIEAAPLYIQYEAYSGKMDSWDSFGQWIIKLNKDRNILPESTRQKVHELAASSKTKEEKVKLLYNYLQSRTRYVSIQLGIGGYQPFEATVVDQTGYGDCKALANYMVAMLNEVGIEANYALIMAGENASKMDTDFPSTQFNHAIAAVPNGADTIWLECTSQTNPFGYQGRFTGNRKALLITENGAKPVNTIRYKANQSIQSRKAIVALDITGDATAQIKTTYTGLQYENGGLDQILSNQFDEQKKWLQENTEIPSFDIVSFNMKNIKEKIPSAIVTMELALKRLSTTSGKRLFLTPNLLNRSTSIPEKVELRKTNVVLPMGYVDYDTVQFNLPENIYPEFTSGPIKYASRFGEYEAHFTFDQGKLIYIRKMSMNEGIYPPESYNELIEFKKNINKADNTKVVFVNKT